MDNEASISRLHLQMCAIELQRSMPTIPVIIMIESAKAVANIHRIACFRTSPARLHSFAFGAADYTYDLGISISKDGRELIDPRSRLAVASRAAELPAPLDTPYMENLKDMQALLTVFTAGRIRKRRRVNLFKKSVPEETVTRTISLVLVSIGIISIVLFLLLTSDPVTGREINGPPHTFLAYLFETVSAFGTVGLSMGITPELGTWGKGWIIFMMIVGRVGVLTFSYIIVGTGTVNGITHAEENMMIG